MYDIIWLATIIVFNMKLFFYIYKIQIYIKGNETLKNKLYTRQIKWEREEHLNKGLRGTLIVLHSLLFFMQHASLLFYYRSKYMKYSYIPIFIVYLMMLLVV
jgi:hypothetical protein